MMRQHKHRIPIVSHVDKVGTNSPNPESDTDLTLLESLPFSTIFFLAALPFVLCQGSEKMAARPRENPKEKKVEPCQLATSASCAISLTSAWPSLQLQKILTLLPSQ